MQQRDTVDDIAEQWRRVDPGLDLEAMALIGRLRRLNVRVDSALREYFLACGLDSSEFDVLATLRRSGEPYELNARALLKSAMVTSGAITNRVDKLCAKGLVERNPCPTDRRAVLVRLTPAGKALIDATLPGHLRNEERILTALDADERAQLDALLRKLLIAHGDTESLFD
ncbi:MarR family winged helix-turn-helix transcriptional regulator [Kitasatospora aureofaciens]|uniref:MarR family transcriptional regulator n=1 Tax=Kitasatospora aureofaciens TaxID=1894 RepID=A0A1E7MWY8_KITAU|nr:MarR family transcriptional regulator [Kitasatospora aureofaciens]QEU99418.1 MarR family transcriptional regulator [Streptomyces viridifaciens]ARF78202.1 MarR family transcriptional regulator [Kitasatospora aureofaciens]OEV32753.1 MarR family transcriptional regulator [Kitasatospora aureofaciens]UKZ05501.1 MarR family transcriptional regulator [Streptomyces viridifaciens]GGU80998.1 MarR family transcriptional regulator [Kitasatospora aureofaciens]